MKRIVLATLGSLGDLHPYLAIGEGLRARGHVVAVATVNAYRPRVEALGLEHRPLGPHLDPEDAGLAKLVVDVKQGSRNIFRDLLMPGLRESWTETLAAVEGADLVVSHPITVGVPIAAELRGFRWASSLLAPLSLFSLHEPVGIPGHPVLTWIFEHAPWTRRSIQSLGRLETSRWVAPIRELRRELGLGDGAHPLFEGQHSSHLVLALFSSVLAARQPDWPANVVVTGFCPHDRKAGHETLAPELVRFLDGGPPPVVFTLGSTAVHAAGDFYEESAAAARAVGRRAVLLAGRARVDAAAGPDVLVADYAPHSLLFPRAAAVVCSGGIGTIGAALRAGRPFVVVPVGNDQPDNAMRCARLGISRTVPRPRYRRDRAAESLGGLLADGSVAASVEDVGRKVSAEDGVATACTALERLL